MIEFARRWGWQMMAAASSAVILFSALRGVARGYEPIGDNALIELRGRDVLTSDHPFLGTWSSASISAGIDVNHPGPLLFEVVTVPLRLLGESAGIALAIAILNIAMVWLVGWVTHRVGGPTAAIAAQAVTAGLVWTLGSELLYDPWQPNVLVLPFWVVLCTVWAIVAGDVGVFPLACGVGSFAMQTHLSYIVIVPTLLAFAVVVTLRRRWHGGPGRFDDLRRPAALSVGVILLLWAQPLLEQFFGAGQGNLSRVVVAGTGGGDGERVESARTGLSVGIRMLGSVLALPPWWGRPGYDDSIPNSASGLPSLAAAVLGLALFGLLVGFAWRWAAGRRESRLVAGFSTLAVALAIASITVVITPIDVLGLSPHKVRWLWVIGAFATFVLLLTGLTALGSRGGRGEERRQQAVGVLAGVAAVLLLATLPTHINPAGPVTFAVTYESIDDLRDQLDEFLTANDVDAVLFDAEGIGFAEPYTAPVMAELLSHGVDLVVDDSALARQLGPDREADPSDPTDGGRRSLVWVRAGQEAAETPAGTLRLAFHDGDRSPFSVVNVTDRAVAVFMIPGEPGGDS